MSGFPPLDFWPLANVVIAMVTNAIRVPANELDQHLAEIPKDRAVITYCT